ncbi:MAG: SRPBCC domain-containing protein [Ignavibacteriae bacterium]|nr:SRPBCC domain-containing protein [Ignavibacteriota bacterium]
MAANDSQTAFEEIVITREFNAPRELVWKAWTEPERVKKWWGPEHFTAPNIKIDLKVRGKYIWAMRGPAGTQWDKLFYTAGVYKEIVPNEKLVITQYLSDENGNVIDPIGYNQSSDFPREMFITVLFEETGKDKTKLSIIYPPPVSKAQMEALVKSRMTEGWDTSLNKLAASLK